MDSPWCRLPWTLPTTLLIWAAALWGLAYFTERPTYRPAGPPPIDAQLIELPGPVAAETIEPGPPAAVEQPKPPPPVIPRQVPVRQQVSPRTRQKPVAQKAKVITSAAAAPGDALSTPSEEEAPAAENTSSNSSALAGGGNNGSGSGSLEMGFGSPDGPRFLLKTMPVYPPVAKRLQKEGTVLLRLTIDERGRPVDVEIVKGAGFGFDEEAVKAVKRSTFVPAKRGGKPLACRALLPIRFVLKQS